MSRFYLPACALLLAACAHAGTTDDDGIALPRMPRAGERVLLEVDVGAIGTGREIVLRTLDGKLIGTISPHGIRQGHAAGTYVVPVPADALASSLDDGRLRLQFVIEPAGAAPRPATTQDVLGVRAIVTGNDPPR